MAETTTTEKTISIQQMRYLQMMEKKKLRQLSQRMRMTQRLLNENTVVKESLAELGKGTKDAIIPLGAGVYASGSITANSFKRTLPGNIVLPASMEEVKKELEAREKVYAHDMTQLEKEMQGTVQNVNSMTALLQMSKKKAKKE